MAGSLWSFFFFFFPVVFVFAINLCYYQSGDDDPQEEEDLAKFGLEAKYESEFFIFGYLPTWTMYRKYGDFLYFLGWLWLLEISKSTSF